MLLLELTLIERNSFVKRERHCGNGWLSSEEATTREQEIGDFGCWNAEPDLAIFYDNCIAGKGSIQIAKILTAGRVLTVTAYHARQKGWGMPDNLYQMVCKTCHRDIGTSGIHQLYRPIPNP